MRQISYAILYLTRLTAAGIAKASAGIAGAVLAAVRNSTDYANLYAAMQWATE